jgi:hypothetical protein
MSKFYSFGSDKKHCRLSIREAGGWNLLQEKAWVRFMKWAICGFDAPAM